MANNILSFIHLGKNPKNVSGYSRKAYQVRVDGTTVTRIYGPVSVIGRKTVWDRKRTKVDVCASVAEAMALVRQIVADRMAHNYEVALPGEVPVN